MNFKSIILICLLFSCCALENAQTYNLSINPAPLYPSYYDYMIGSYNSLPMKIIPPEFGGGVFTVFHARTTAGSDRNIFYTYLNSNGMPALLDSVVTITTNNGYPSMDFDESSGIGFMAWHGKVGTDTYSSVYGAFILSNNGVLDTLSSSSAIISPTNLDTSYLWPIVKIGNSPNSFMRRIYVMAKHSGSLSGHTVEYIKIAYADINPLLINSETVPEWSFITIPEIQTWANDNVIGRLFNYTLVLGSDDKIYLVGYHSSSNINTDAFVDEPNLDVFTCDNFGTGTWSRTSIHAEQNPSCQLPDTDVVLSAQMYNSSHFNAVLDNAGNIQFPQLFSYGWLEEGVSFYYLDDIQSIRHIEYNTQSETFRIDDLYPQGASPHSDPAYTPWDINEDGVPDEYDEEGNVIYPTTWPFPYWDSAVHLNAMFYYYNKQMMTEPNQYGWMATVWQDSNEALTGTHIPEIVDPPFWPCSEIYVSLSPDNGWTWFTPLRINSVDFPIMNNLKPMWVYPANKLVVQSLVGNTLTCRLYLLFYDDNTWGAYNISGPVGSNDGGNVMYMAIDISMQITSNQDESETLPSITLCQNYPNPFIASTEIKYSLSEDSNVNLCIYNIKGQLVKTLVNNYAKAGNQSIVWNGKDENNIKVASGLYLYKLNTNGKTLSHKMLMLK